MPVSAVGNNYNQINIRTNLNNDLNNVGFQKNNSKQSTQPSFTGLGSLIFSVFVVFMAVYGVKQVFFHDKKE